MFLVCRHRETQGMQGVTYRKQTFCIFCSTNGCVYVIMEEEQQRIEEGYSMEIVVTAMPHILLESVELLYAYVNNISPEFLTCPGTYCLPVNTVQEIMDKVCKDIPLDNAALRYYFGKRVFYEDPEQTTCIARNLCYNNSAVFTGSVEEAFKQLRSLWQFKTKRNWRLTGIDRYNLSFSGSRNNEYVPIADDLAELGISAQYSNVLLEQLAGYEGALDRLEALITPVAHRLEPLLLPWAQQAEPLAQAWQDYYSGADAESRLYQKISYKQDIKVESLHVQLRYLRPKDGPGNTWGGRSMYLYTGVAIPVESYAQEGFERWEFQALRLLGSEARMQMLQAMMSRPMSSRELAKELNMHLGVVTRDISSLREARLLTMELSNRYRRYRTNTQTLQTLIRHLSDLENCTIFRTDHL